MNTSTDRTVSDPLIRRIEAAISNATASRSVIEFDWPECHRKGCQDRHGDVDSAFHNMKTQIVESVRDELRYEMTTRPDVADEGDTPEQEAVYALAVLMNRYNVHHAGTFVKAAQLMVEAYPKLIGALSADPDTETAQHVSPALVGSQE